MYKVGLTGGIGSGKSKVAEFLRDREVAIYDSDSRAKELMMSNEALREALIAEFGQECYTADGINRAWLEADAAQWVKDVLDDADKPVGYVFNRFYADCNFSGTPIDWEEVI